MNEESVFAAALEKATPEARAAFLKEACAGDVELQGQVEALLKSHENPDRFLQAPAAPVVLATVEEPITERPGTVIGPYKLMEQIGEGGMGLVFVAEQMHPVRRKVALKLIKPGMDTREVMARFQAEQQALAVMDHPNIARVLDAGTVGQPFQADSSPTSQPGKADLPTGRPYFVMELVRGIPITDYCDQNQLTTRQRLELFVSVCQAVQHAHQKGIVHRDIKPSNVMVTLHDGTPVVKVIDFGVAKAIGPQLTERTVYTRFMQMIGTPLYMSPEQAEMSGLDIDTRSDIYSLGVLLYELLTGTTPFDKDRLREASYDEIRRIIREEEPPKPSTRISTLGQASATVSAQRKSDPKRLSQLFRGELDWIVMKTLEKDRNRRYETASALAADVQRYLKDEPVEACPPSVGYRLRKYARRNRAKLVVGACGIAVLLAGVLSLAIGSLLIWREKEQTRAALTRAEEEREEADVQRRRAEANFRRAMDGVDFLVGRLYGPERSDRPVLTEVRRAQAQHALDFFGAFLKEDDSAPAGRLQKAIAYVNIGNIFQMQGEHARAQSSYSQAVSLFSQLVADYPDDHVYRVELGAAHCILGLELNSTGQIQKASVEFERTLEQYQQALRLAPDEPRVHSMIAWFRTSCPDPQFRNPAEAVQHVQTAFRLAPQHAIDLTCLGVAHYTARNYPAALSALEKSVQLHAGGDSLDWFFLAMTHCKLGHPQEARRWYDKGLQWRREKNRLSDGELDRFRAKAGDVLGIKDLPPLQPESIPLPQEVLSSTPKT